MLIICGGRALNIVPTTSPGLPTTLKIAHANKTMPRDCRRDWKPLVYQRGILPRCDKIQQHDAGADKHAYLYINTKHNVGRNSDRKKLHTGNYTRPQKSNDCYQAA